MASRIAESQLTIRKKGLYSDFFILYQKMRQAAGVGGGGGGWGWSGGHHTRREGKEQHDLGALFPHTYLHFWQEERLDESVSGLS